MPYLKRRASPSLPWLHRLGLPKSIIALVVRLRIDRRLGTLAVSNIDPVLPLSAHAFAAQIMSHGVPSHWALKAFCLLNSKMEKSYAPFQSSSARWSCEYFTRQRYLRTNVSRCPSAGHQR